MNILVTGGAGFIGSHTVERLLASGGHQVTILDSFNDYYNPAIKRANVAAMAGRATVVEGELTDAPLIQKTFELGRFDAVVHLAARAGVAISRQELAQLTAAGVERSVDVQVTRLRRKIERDPREPVHLQTVRGVGYRLTGE